ncbi:hypothetical protein ANABIO32_00520 [Rossellomorea marisflavi]|nr:hypothetical protein ANABIO32_00520 [Rossellomorea marisflavi]
MIKTSTYAKLIQQLTLSHRLEMYEAYTSGSTVPSADTHYRNKLSRLQKRLEKYHGINKSQWSQMYEQALTF